MGTETAAPPSPSWRRCARWCGAAMADGAVGFSTGLQYVPGTYARPSEIIDLARSRRQRRRRLCHAHAQRRHRARAGDRRSRSASAHRRRAGADLAPQGGQPEQVGREREGPGADRCGEGPWHQRRWPISTRIRRPARRSASASRPGRSRAAPRPSRRGSTTRRSGRRSRKRWRALLAERGLTDLSFAVVASLRRRSLAQRPVDEAGRGEAEGLGHRRRPARGGPRPDARRRRVDGLPLHVATTTSSASCGTRWSASRRTAACSRRPGVAASARLRQQRARARRIRARSATVIRLEEAVRKMTSLPAGHFRFDAAGW